jgi:DNA-directed RNA polymerase I, II, and III subunit RPABC3
MDRVSFEDTFEVLAVDSERFDRVSRIKAQAQTFLAEIEVDINTEIYPIAQKETLSIALAVATEDGGFEGGRSGSQGLIDMFEYVMFGKVFKKTNTAANKVQVYASFGGLLMCLEGERSDMDVFSLDDRLYLLVKKVH